MTIRYQIASQVLGAAGYIGPMVNAENLRLVYVNRAGGVDTVASWYDEMGRHSSWTTHPGGAVNVTSCFQNFTITGTGATIEGAFVTPEDNLDAATLLIGGSDQANVIQTGIVTGLAGTFTVAYTCPAGRKATLLGMTLKGATGDVWTAWVRRSAGVSNDKDLLTVRAGFTAAAPGFVYLGLGPANDIVIPPTYQLLAGDTLVVADQTSAASNVDIELYETPL